MIYSLSGNSPMCLWMGSQEDIPPTLPMDCLNKMGESSFLVKENPHVFHTGRDASLESAEASPERVYEAPTQQPRPASLWTRAQRAASVPAAAPAASASSQAAPQDPQVSAAPAERQVSQGSSLRSLEDLLPTKFAAWITKDIAPKWYKKVCISFNRDFISDFIDATCLVLLRLWRLWLFRTVTSSDTKIDYFSYFFAVEQLFWLIHEEFGLLFCRFRLVLAPTPHT